MSKRIDMTGWIMKEHGVPDSKWTVLYKDTTVHNGHGATWTCQCECGNIHHNIRGDTLRSGLSKSCGCVGYPKLHKDISGILFGSLTPLYEVGKRKNNSVVWMCKCECGGFKEASVDELRNWKITSCGCKCRSGGMSQIKNILDANNIKYLEDKPYFKDLIIRTGLGRYDFIIFNEENNVIRLIEFDGEQHYSQQAADNFHRDLEYFQSSDQIKNEYAKNHNYPLVRIPYKCRNITYDDIFGDKYLI